MRGGFSMRSQIMGAISPHIDIPVADQFSLLSQAMPSSR
jgi:hypothetical protein